MSQPPLDTESASSIAKDGVLAFIIGGLAALARVLLSTRPTSPGWVIRRILSAGIVAVCVGFGMQDWISTPGVRLACIGACSYAAPEILDAIIHYFRKKDIELNGIKPRTRKRKKITP